MTGPISHQPVQLKARYSAQHSEKSSEQSSEQSLEQFLEQPRAPDLLPPISTTPFIKSLIYRTAKTHTLLPDRVLYRSGSGRHLAPPERRTARYTTQSKSGHKAQSMAQNATRDASTQYAVAKYSPDIVFQPFSQLSEQTSAQPPAKHPAQARTKVQSSSRCTAESVSVSTQKTRLSTSLSHRWLYDAVLAEYQINIIAVQPNVIQYAEAPLLQFSVSENPAYLRHISKQLVKDFSQFLEAHAHMNITNYSEIIIRWSKVPLYRYEQWERFLYSCALSNSNKYFRLLVAIDDPPLDIGLYEFSLWFTLLYVMKAGDTKIKNAVIHYFKCKYATHWKRWQEDRLNREHREKIAKSLEGNYFRSSFEEKNNWRLLAEFDANVPACTPKALDYENFYEVSRDEELRRWEQNSARYEKHNDSIPAFLSDLIDEVHIISKVDRA
ncbi:hypothetical protein BZA77DRAFT_357869 [Pyronema omphalodes]|nr:hypothetical protein BZA77DRAFT_357869 [Pyronema omphalodes]